MENFAHQYPSRLYQYGHPIFRALSNYRQRKEMENHAFGLWNRRGLSLSKVRLRKSSQYPSAHPTSNKLDQHFGK